MVHTFVMHGLRLALDVESGALHVLDEPAFFAVRAMAEGKNRDLLVDWLAERYGLDEAMGVLREVAELQEKGLLFSAPRPVRRKAGGVVKALCLHLAHDCNMRCVYCFARDGSYGGARGLMPAEIALQAVDFLLEQSGGRRHLEIDFFGGEPLLNFPVLRETVAYGRQRAGSLGKVLKFTVTTNALALSEEIIQFLNEEDISIVLSLDGRREVHDRMRSRPGGGSTFLAVLENCKRLVADRGGENYYIRGTYTRHNLDFGRDVLALVAEGFDRISLEPAVLTPDWAEALQPEDLPALEDEYVRLADALWKLEKKGKRVRFFHFEFDLNQGPCAAKRVSGCGAGSVYLAVTPDGSLYPCHQFAGKENFRAGHVSVGPAPEILSAFQALDTVDKEACRRCFARYFCGGGCHASAWLISGDLNKPYELGCALHRKRVECGLYLQAQRLLWQKQER